MDKSDIDEKTTNLVYQAYRDYKGGSDSARKLAALCLPDLSGKRFLDLGCNAGYFCAYAQEQGASYVLGVDVSDRVIELAKERYPNIEFRSGGWDRFPDGEFDVVICLSAIHYAADPSALANTIRHALSPEGLFVLEGGLYLPDEASWSDLLLPVWREVGDRVRHLTSGYVARHLLKAFDWQLVGTSIQQGGDPLERFVIHAKPGGHGEPERSHHRVCLREYSQGIALSGATISQQQPSYEYVRLLSSRQGELEDALDSIMNQDHLRTPFVDDLVFALGSSTRELQIKHSVDGRVIQALSDNLARHGMETAVTHD